MSDIDQNEPTELTELTELTPIYIDNGLFYLVELNEEQWRTYWKPNNNNKCSKNKSK